MAAHEHDSFAEGYDSYLLNHAVLVENLSEAPIFDATSPITQFIEERVDLLCGDDIPRPPVYVVDSAEPGACIAGNGLIVNRGLLDLLQYEEEVDAALGHELAHFEHHGEGVSHSNPASAIGVVRAHETEADLRGMELLSRRGINPRGSISLFETLARHTKTRAETKNIAEHFIDSPTHGRSADRAINLEQAAWHLDLPHLSPSDLTPLSFARSAADTIGQHVEQDDHIRRQAAIGHAIRQAFQEYKDDGHSHETALPYALSQPYLEQQAALMAEIHPELRDEEVHELAMLAGSKFGAACHLDVSADNPLDANRLERAFQNLDHPALTQLVGSFNKETREHVAESYILQALNEKMPDLMLLTFIEACEKQFGDFIFARPFAIKMTQLEEDEERNQASINRLCAIAARTKLPLYFISSNKELTRHPRYTIEELRLKEAAAQPTVMDLLAYVSHYNCRIDQTVKNNEAQLLPEFRTWRSDSEDESTANFRSQGLTSAQQSLLYGHNVQGENSAVQRLYIDCMRTDPATFTRELLSYTDDEELRKTMSTIWIEVFLELHGYRGQFALLSTLYTADPAHTRRLLGSFFEENIEYISSTLGIHVEMNEAESDDDFDDSDDYDEDDEAENEEGEDEDIFETARFVSVVLNKCLEQTREVLCIDGLDPAELAARSAFVDNLVIDSEKIRSFALLQGLESYAHHGDATALLSLLARVEPPKFTVSSFTGDDHLHAYAQACWKAALTRLLDQPNVGQDDESLRLLMVFGLAAEDTSTNLHVPARALNRLVEERNFDEGMQLVFGTYGHLPSHVLRNAVVTLIESKAKTLDDFAKLEARLLENLEQFVDLHHKEIGTGSIIETNVLEAYRTHQTKEREVGLKHDVVKGMESVRLLRALLMSAEDDAELKQYMFERWWLRYRTDFQGKIDVEAKFRVEDIAIWRYPHKKSQLEHWIKEIPRHDDYQPLGATLDKLYVGNAALRHITVRKLLLGKGGVLTEAAGRQALVEALMQTWLAYEEGSATDSILHNILQSLMESAGPERLYHYLGPVLQDLILHPPHVQTSFDDIATRQANIVVDTMLSRKKISKELGNEREAVRRKVINLARGNANDQDAAGRSTLEDRLFEIFVEAEDESIGRISPTELALMVGKKSGAVGVRMLQLAGQYYDIPENEREKYNEVYDSMKGQTRLQAYKVLAREAKTNARVAELLDNIELFGERLGGGSLMTVYEVTMKDGSRQVIGVRNPNAEYHATQIAELAYNALDRAIENDPENADLKIAQSLVIDAVTWIRNELNDTTFTAKDAVFRAENDTREGTGFRRGRSRYDLYVPKANETGTLWIRNEELVPGVNLNGLTIAHDEPTDLASKRISQADFQDAVSTLVRNALFQIRRGRFAHSDMHMGNFRIVEGNNRIAVFDRYNLIEMTDELRATLKQTITHVASGRHRDAVEAVLHSVTPEEALADDVVRTIADSVAHGEADLTKTMANLVIGLKRANISIPLELSLIMRNIFSLARLSHKAGFDNLVEAFMHTADEQEVQDLLADLAA